MKHLLMACLCAVSVVALPGAAGEKQPPAGFTSLFDGKTLTGWKHMGKETAAEVWKVDNGAIHCTGAKIKGAGNLATEKAYGDFELYLDWKIEKAGDSGIYLRGQPQVQIWDSFNIPKQFLAEDGGKGSGGMWNNPKGSPGKQPLVNADAPVGEWNTFHIKMVGDRVTIKLNDKLVVDNAPFVPLGKAPPATGTIELQFHGDPLWFRNIYVKELK
jgi:hypothetical protein